MTAGSRFFRSNQRAKGGKGSSRSRRTDFSFLHHGGSHRHAAEFDGVMEATPRRPDVAHMERAIQFHRTPPGTCWVLLWCVLSGCGIGLSVPELMSLTWWKNTDATVFSWLPGAMAGLTIFLSLLSLMCKSRLCMCVSSCSGIIMLPLVIAQLATVSAPAVLALCCCFPHQCVLDLGHDKQNPYARLHSNTVAKELHLNQTCHHILPYDSSKWTCATNHWSFGAFWLGSALVLIFGSCLVSAQCFYVRGPRTLAAPRRSSSPATRRRSSRRGRRRHFDEYSDNVEDSDSDLSDSNEMELREAAAPRRSKRQSRKQKQKKAAKNAKRRAGAGTKHRPRARPARVRIRGDGGSVSSSSSVSSSASSSDGRESSGDERVDRNASVIELLESARTARGKSPRYEMMPAPAAPAGAAVAVTVAEAHQLHSSQHQASQFLSPRIAPTSARYN